MKTVWSSGGGVQSNAIAALIVQGKLPKPDIAVIVDTEQEMSSTWDYYERVTKPAPASVGVDLIRIPKSRYATVGYFSKNGDTFLMPVFTDFTGEPAKLPTNCSNEWKERVVQRYSRELYPDAKQFSVWIGITIDEPKRFKQSTGKWLKDYPLARLRMRRHDCINLVVNEMGWPLPPKSTCWNCPNKGHEDWMAQKRDYPADFEAACQFDEWMRREVDDTFYLHRSCKPLRDVTEGDCQGDLFTGRCDSGFCMT